MTSSPVPISDRGRFAGLAEAMAWAIIIAVFFDRLLESWYRARFVPMSDQLAYADLARASVWFWDTGQREPLHVHLVGVALAFAPSEDVALRAVTTINAVLTLLVVALWTRRTAGCVGALIATGILALNHAFLFYAPQGFNIGSYVLMLAIVLALIDADQNPPAGRALRWRDFRVGFGVGLLGLARLEGILVGGTLAVADALARGGSIRQTMRSAALRLLVSALIVAPYLVHQTIAFGSPLESHQRHARFWQNTLSISEGSLHPDVDRYLGGPLRFAEVTVDAPLAIVWRSTEGYAQAFGWYLPRLVGWPLLLAAAGLAACLRRRRLSCPGALFLVILPMAAILTIDQVGPGSGVEARFLLPTLVPICGLIAVGAESVRGATFWRSLRARL